MTLLKEAEAQKKFDTRMIDRAIERGRLSQKDIEDHIKSLPDDGSEAEWSDTTQLQDLD